MEDDTYLDELTDTAIFSYEPEAFDEGELLEDEREVIANFFL